MSEPPVTGRPPGPKTAIRTGSVRDPFGLILGEHDRAALQDRGAAVRRSLADEIRAQATRPARKKRRR
jgi:hypothetical protein